MGHEHNVIDSDRRFIIDPIKRTVKSENNQKIMLMQNDHNSERFTFQCPKTVEGHDMSECNKIQVHFLNIEATTRKENKGLYEVDDLMTEDNNVVFSWLIKMDATRLVGPLAFVITFLCVKDGVVEYRWSTAENTEMSIGNGINADERFEVEYSDIIYKWKESVMQTFRDDLNEWKSQKEAELDSNIENKFFEHSAEWNQKLDVERARIDQFTKLEEGSTTGDAELQDIRVGNDGNIYDNAGEAVRGQFEQITMKMTKVICPNRRDPSAVVNGYMVNSTGILMESQTYVTTGYIEVKAGDVVSLWNGTSRYSFRFITAFDSMKMLLNDKGTGESGDDFVVPEGVSYIRMSHHNELEDPMILVNEDNPKAFIPYQKSPYYVSSDEFLSAYTKNEIDKMLSDFKVSPNNTTFFDVSPNIFNGVFTRGYYVNQTTGQVQVNDNHQISDYISILPNTEYVFSNADNFYGNLRYAIYNEDKKYITGNVDTPNVVAHEDASYIRFSVYIGSNWSREIQLEEGTVPSAYRPYDDNKIPDFYIKKTSKEFELNLPSKLYALVGEELNVYFDNIVEGRDTDYVFDVICEVGQHMEHCYRLIPEKAGSYAFTISATKDDVTMTKKTTIVVSSSDNGSGKTKKVIILGDSTTNNGIAVSKLNANFANDVMNIKTLGTRGTAPNNQEGRSGWTFRQYFETDSSGDVNNPFYNPESNTFDSRYYFDNSGVDVPDYFIINLGINDTFGYQDDKTLGEEIERLNDYCDSMIANLRNTDSAMKICIALTIPPNYSQDAFGKAYKCGQTRNRYKRNNILWVANLISRYDNREEEGIYVIPIHTNLDTRYNMGMETVQYNKRNTATYEQLIANGGVHPVESGYWQIADVYWFFLKNNALD